MTKDKDHQSSLPESDLPTGLARPAQRALAGAGLVRLEQLSRVSEDEVLELHGMGPKALDQLRRALAEKGLSFANTSYSREEDIKSLYQSLLDSWNQRTAEGYAALFSEDGNVVGFDGSQMNGRREIASQLGRIFADHQTARYLAKVREVRFLTGQVAVLRAVVGMVPPGQNDINPAANAVQTLVAVRREGGWHIAVFHNTPAAYHGRPELAEKLTEELRELL
ncbi:MAG TPA: SgcJ/EcaC family oxidoreductase [Anaerolineales bacterium]|nr:SgcJ/EcaC family oxidoreductase [Anaerolineales bacterium]